MGLGDSKQMATSIVVPKGALTMQTRARNDIDNYFDKRAPLPGEQRNVDDLIAKYWNTKPRTRTPSAHYDCHGLTFASRRSGITQSTVVRQILADDGYQAVALADVLPGDTIVYAGDLGEIEHSGIVVGLIYISGGSGRVLDTIVVSKWGGAHEVIHRSKDCPWANSKQEYYRMPK